MNFHPCCPKKQRTETSLFLRAWSLEMSRICLSIQSDCSSKGAPQVFCEKKSRFSSNRGRFALTTELKFAYELARFQNGCLFQGPVLSMQNFWGVILEPSENERVPQVACALKAEDVALYPEKCTKSSHFLPHWTYTRQAANATTSKRLPLVFTRQQSITSSLVVNRKVLDYSGHPQVFIPFTGVFIWENGATTRLGCGRWRTDGVQHSPCWPQIAHEFHL